MRPRILPLLLALSVVVALTGCFGGEASSEPHKLILEEAPTTGKVGDIIVVKYRVEGPSATAQYNFLRYDTESHPYKVGVRAEDYRSFTFQPGKQTMVPVPANFSVALKLEKPGPLYYRVNVGIPPQDLWSEEIRINVTAAS
ncbi:MAG TPA: hypothetical protein VNZ52_14930 [Candidatus Thermoplasmatota archaeon]|nr:hypothetical protein [Candidatus Thermoplasmatota archaeon]